MRAFSLMYHDVVEPGDYDASGFPGEGAHIYKLDRPEFARHLEAIKNAIGSKPVQAVARQWGSSTPVYLTFDDGGASAHDPIAGMLEERNWRGHFFITTSRIGQRGFVDAAAVRDLDRRGHVIGSHSSTHPPRMSHIGRSQMLREWKDSTAALADLLAHPVTIASVPGGFYSRAVAETAAEAGIEVLFTSEPTAAVGIVENCLVLGRYVVQRGMLPACSAGFAAGALMPRFKQALLWKSKKAAKALGGTMYLRLREALLRR
jgi:peptidoglycan/xylan/chitin deacetylase (PgdA/CDA1 family)